MPKGALMASKQSANTPTAPGGSSGDFQYKGADSTFQGSVGLEHITGGHTRVVENYELQFSGSGAKIYTDGGTLFIQGIAGDTIHFNASGLDVDYRIDGDTLTFALKMKASNGAVGIGGVTNPVGRAHIAGGTTAIAQLVLGIGTQTTTPQDGAIEYNGTRLTFVIGSTRQEIELAALAQTITAAKTHTAAVTLGKNSANSGKGCLVDGSGDLQTSNATIATLATIATTSNHVYIIEAAISGITRSSATEVSTDVLIATFRNDGGVFTQIGSTTVVQTQKSDGTWGGGSISASGTDILIRVTGKASTTIRWHAVYRLFSCGA